MAGRLITLRMTIDQPLDLATTLDSGQAFRWRSKGKWVVGVVEGNVVQMRRVARELELTTSPTPPDEMAPVLWRYLRLDDDLPAIQRAVCVDRHVAQAVRQYPGMRLLRQNPWECLIAFICSAASNIPRVCRTIEQLAQAYGEPRRLGKEIRYTFPGPERLAEASEAELRALGLGFRAPYVPQVARAVVEGKVNLSLLRTSSYQEAKTALTTLPGVGEKVADCVLLFSLDKLEAFPIDRWVRRALEEWYLRGKRLNYQQMHLWAVDYFGQYAGYAQQYLFHRRRREGSRRGHQ